MHAIEVRALTKNYKNLVAVEKVSFGLRAGETVVAFACCRTNLETQASIFHLERFLGLGIETGGAQYFVKIGKLSWKK
jgi:hypothetical protein